MTNEEAIKKLKEFKILHTEQHGWDVTTLKALDMAIEAFEQEPSEDCVSRKAVINYIRKLSCDLSYWSVTEEVVKDIENLPPVTPQQKTGHWIEDAKTYYEELDKRGLGVDEYTPYFTDDIACSECLAKYSVLDNETQFFKCCPNCGAKMESEVGE